MVIGGKCSLQQSVYPEFFELITMDSKSAVLNLFRVADHLTNFVSVRGPPKMSTFSEFLTTFLVIFPLNFSRLHWGNGCKILGDGCMGRPLSHPKFWGNRPPYHQKEFSQFSQFPCISQGQGQKNIQFSFASYSCDTIHKKVPSLSSHSFVRNQPERRWGQF